MPTCFGFFVVVVHSLIGEPLHVQVITAGPDENSKGIHIQNQTSVSTNNVMCCLEASWNFQATEKVFTPLLLLYINRALSID